MAPVVERTLPRHPARNRHEANQTVDANLSAGRLRRILVGARFVVRLTPSLYDASRRIDPYPRPVAVRLLSLSET